MTVYHLAKKYCRLKNGTQDNLPTWQTIVNSEMNV